MTRDEHLKFCKVCLHRKPNMQLGLLCGLTDKMANFDPSCSNFEKDEQEAELLYLRELDAAGDGESGHSSNYEKNKTTGAVIAIIGGAIFLFTLFNASIPIIIIPFGAILYGMYQYNRGVKQEKIAIARQEELGKKKDEEAKDLLSQ